MRAGLLIFAKAPELGRVKTRLKLSPENAIELHVALLKDVISRSAGDWAQELWTTDATHPLFASFGLDVYEQSGETLGDRLENAFLSARSRYDKIIVIGADAPSLPKTIYAQAFATLEVVDTVLGPSCDGGFYLYGSRRHPVGLFKAPILWGTSSVLADLLRRISVGNSTLQLLPFWFDIDRPSDLDLLKVLPRDFELKHTDKLLKCWALDEECEKKR